MMPENGAVVQLTASGPPVGLFEDAAYDAATIVLPEDGTALVYTDGVVEALSPAEEEFGLARLIDIFSAAHHTPDGLLRAVMSAVRDWSGDREQGDDITLLALTAATK
jgi:sigma-B regulation protein RsbU (phosphoserine phosphatase)